MSWTFDCGRIKLAREARGITQLQLAQDIGIYVQRVSDWECGNSKPSQDSLGKICNALQTPPQFFYVQTGKNGNVGNDGEYKEAA